MNKFFSVLILLALLLSAGPGAVMATELSPIENSSSSNPDIAPGLDEPVNEWTDADLEKLVNLIFNEQITVSQSEAIAKQLTAEQTERVKELFAINVDSTMERAYEEQLPHSSSQTIGLQGEIWRQYIEYYGNMNYGRLADYYYSSPECEGIICMCVIPRE